jgi:predicted small lipoprotein YifL
MKGKKCKICVFIAILSGSLAACKQKEPEKYNFAPLKEVKNTDLEPQDTAKDTNLNEKKVSYYDYLYDKTE